MSLEIKETELPKPSLGDVTMLSCNDCMLVGLITELGLNGTTVQHIVVRKMNIPNGVIEGPVEITEKTAQEHDTFIMKSLVVWGIDPDRAEKAVSECRSCPAEIALRALGTSYPDNPTPLLISDNP